jgi:hypothetical protein
MAEQNFKNHSRYVPLYHFIASTAILALIIGSCINLFDAVNKNAGLYSASLICLMSFVLCLVWFFARSFALRAQDRAIRAEENLRHFSITGKLLDNRLTMGQIIALRFASNNEFVALANRAAEENMKSVDIKKAIQNWREDNDRA